MLYTCVLVFCYIALVICCTYAITSSQKQVEDSFKELKDCIERRHNENNRPDK